MVILFSSGTQYMNRNQEQIRSGLHEHNLSSVEVGTAQYADGPTGATVIYFPKGARGAVDIRGGAAAVREASSLSSFNTWGTVDGLVIAGGSTYGLEAADGVCEALLKLRNNSTKFQDIPAVPAAIVYDFLGRDNAIYPDKELGALAFKQKKANVVEYGNVGAGTFVSVGKYLGRKYAQKSGQAVGFLEIGKIKILVISVVNALGNIVDRKGNIIAGSFDQALEKHISIPEFLINKINNRDDSELKNEGNTTITTLITNAKLSRSDLQRIGMMCHTSMGQVIDPFHTPHDGDSFFTFSTMEESLPKGFVPGDLGVLGSELLKDSIIKLFK